MSVEVDRRSTVVFQVDTSSDTDHQGAGLEAQEDQDAPGNTTKDNYIV